MSDDQSEEKTLDPTDRKLRKAREKGQTVTSKETVMSLTGIAGVLYLYFMRHDISEKMMALWELEIENSDRGFAVAFRDKLGIVTELGFLIVVPFLLLTVVVAVLAGMTVAGGPLFSVQPITPDFNRLNPVEGFKRIFSLKALLSFGMHLLRMTLLLGTLGFLLYLSWGTLLNAPQCGFACVGEALSGIALPMAIGGITVMTAMAAVDYLVNRQKFMDEQKMTQTEFKREMKDMAGDPQLKGQMRRERRQMTETKTGARHAILVVAAPPHHSVGIRYVQGETPAPVVVARARGIDAMRQLANASLAPEVTDPTLANALRKTPVGGYIVDDELIDSLVPYLQQAMAQSQAG